MESRRKSAIARGVVRAGAEVIKRNIEVAELEVVGDEAMSTDVIDADAATDTDASLGSGPMDGKTGSERTESAIAGSSTTDKANSPESPLTKFLLGMTCGGQLGLLLLQVIVTSVMIGVLGEDGAGRAMRLYLEEANPIAQIITFVQFLFRLTVFLFIVVPAILLGLIVPVFAVLAVVGYFALLATSSSTMSGNVVKNYIVANPNVVGYWLLGVVIGLLFTHWWETNVNAGAVNEGMAFIGICAIVAMSLSQLYDKMEKKAIDEHKWAAAREYAPNLDLKPAEGSGLAKLDDALTKVATATGVLHKPKESGMLQFVRYLAHTVAGVAYGTGLTFAYELVMYVLVMPAYNIITTGEFVLYTYLAHGIVRMGMAASS